MVTLTLTKTTGRCAGCTCKTDQCGLALADKHGSTMFMCRPTFLREINLLLPPPSKPGDQGEAETK
jgi:hypothetical protein